VKMMPSVVQCFDIQITVNIFCFTENKFRQSLHLYHKYLRIIFPRKSSVNKTRIKMAILLTKFDNNLKSCGALILHTLNKSVEGRNYAKLNGT
jgi:hypothetical protein